MVDDETAAILVEPVQGEGGVNLPPEGFLAGLRQLADDYDLLLIFDEVQTGCGRTGEWFAYQHFDVVPDIMTLAKSLCGGIAGAAMLTTAEIARSLRPGMHAATFGGNPLAAAAGIATLETIEKENLLSRARALSALFRERLEQFVCESEAIREVRILGLMIGIEIDTEGEQVGGGVPEEELAGELYSRQGDSPAAGHDADRCAGPRGLRYSHRRAETTRINSYLPERNSSYATPVDSFRS